MIKEEAKQAVQNDEVWYWQGDGNDHPESLTCLVVIDSDKLRQVQREVAEMVLGRVEKLIQQGAIYNDFQSLKQELLDEIGGEK